MEKLIYVQRNLHDRNLVRRFTRIIMIPIPKKENAIECDDYRTISLTPHASKILSKALTSRMDSKTETNITKLSLNSGEPVGHGRLLV